MAAFAEGIAAGSGAVSAVPGVRQVARAVAFYIIGQIGPRAQRGGCSARISSVPAGGGRTL
eukprot:7948590-Lingulodinium_polyedra.AAC.1